jgi:hypothetical protein
VYDYDYDYGFTMVMMGGLVTRLGMAAMDSEFGLAMTVTISRKQDGLAPTDSCKRMREDHHIRIANLAALPQVHFLQHKDFLLTSCVQLHAAT